MYGYTAYAPSKFALRGFAEVLQMEVKPYNIKVMVSYPPDTGNINNDYWLGILLISNYNYRDPSIVRRN